MVEKRLPWVLVVDGDEANRDAVARMLRGAGFETSEATTGRQAVQFARRDPDVIVLDVNLPDMHGFDVVRELRADPRTAFIPVLHLSASYMGDGDRVIGLDNGANAYLTHPVEPPVFVATVRSLVRVRWLEEAQQSAAAEWQATFDAIGDAVCVIDSGGTVTRANRLALALFGRVAPDVVHKKWLDLMVGAFPGIDHGVLAATLKRGNAVAHDARAGDRWLRITFDPLAAGSAFAGSCVVVVSEITQRKRAEEERSAALTSAEAARTIAESANAAKGEFLAMMSHEIRTPINAILGYAQLLDMGIVGSISQDQRHQLDRLRRSAAHLLRLINEVFDLATVDAGAMRVEREQASVDDVVEDVLAIGRPLALARGITVDATDGTQLYYVGDAGRVRQILVNLLSNAAKFSSPGGRIAIETEMATPAAIDALEASRERRYIAVRVRDSGVGIEQNQLKQIFDPFVQGDTGPTRAFGGSGLGLTISRRLARLMGGDITVESQLGRGSSFTLWLPAAPDQALIETAERPSRRAQSTSFDPVLFAELGRSLSTEALNIGQAIVVRLRTDEGYPPVGGLSDAQLVDHIPAYVSDLGLALVIVSEVGAEASSLLHDGNAIRNEIAERHGAQRRRLGWSPVHIEREYGVVLDEIARVLRVRTTVSEAQLAGGLQLIGRLIAQSSAASLRGFKEAGE